MFVPLRRTRSLRDWFTPLDGCPRCGYAYEREIGYFLMSIWAVGYGFGALFGLAVYFFLDRNFKIPFGWVLGVTMSAVFIFVLLFARHAKSLYLAIDHFFDPPVRDFDNDGGGDAPGAPIAPAPASRAPTDVLKPR